MNKVRADLEVNVDPGQNVVFFRCENKAIRFPHFFAAANFETEMTPL